MPNAQDNPANGGTADTASGWTTKVPPSSPPAERCLVLAHRQCPKDGRQCQKEGCQKPNGERAGRALGEAAGALVERGRDAGDEQRHRRDRERGQIVKDLPIKERRSAR